MSVNCKKCKYYLCVNCVTDDGICMLSKKFVDKDIDTCTDFEEKPL